MIEAPAGPLHGLRIVDISTVVAGPFAAGLLGDYGAHVVKVEMPGAGDSLRALAPPRAARRCGGRSPTATRRVDLRQADGRDLFGKLVAGADVLVENFRPGTLDRWGITRAWLQGISPHLTILRVSGFGQDGPYRDRPGFARIFESVSGFTQICGEEDGRPLHLGYPISDAIAGLFGALGVLAALHDLARHPERRGQEIDCSATEAMLRTLEFLAIEYDQLGVVRTRSGNRSQYAAPGNVYRTQDGKWASIAASTQSIFVRLCRALALDALLEDERFATNQARVKNFRALDDVIGGAIAGLSLDELRKTFAEHEVGFSPIYDIADVFDDPQFAARGAIVRVPDAELGSVRMQGVVPRFSETPGRVHHAGPTIGQHNDEVYCALGLSAAEIAGLKARKVI